MNKQQRKPIDYREENDKRSYKEYKSGSKGTYADSLELDHVLEYVLVNRSRITNVGIRKSSGNMSCKQCGADIPDAERYLRLEISNGEMRSSRTADFCKHCVK